MKNFIIVTFVIIALVYTYARFIGTSGLFIHESEIKNKNIPDSFKDLKILHFGDLHFGRTVDFEKLKIIVNRINETKPDLVIFTGDLIDKDYVLKNGDAENIIKELSQIKSTLGSYAVLGNHDYVIPESEDILINSDFNLLKNEFDLVYYKSMEPILLVGVDDLNEGTPDIEKAMPKENIPIFKIFLTHEPDYFREIDDYEFDVVLSGHSHNGQVRLPFIGPFKKVYGAKKYHKPFYQVGNTEIYITSGIGCSLHNVRLFNRPSMNLYHLKK